MGMTKDSGRGLSKGIEVLTDIIEWGGLEEEENISRGGEQDEKARMMELGAISEASQKRREANQKARLTHDELEETRAKSRTEWGQSGVTLDGSREMVLEGQRDRDSRMESNQALLDDLEEQEKLDKGLREANRYRIDKGRGLSSTLSLGSKVYKTRS
jgi:hypothetical protein